MRVPPGTVVRQDEDDALVGEVLRHGDSLRVARLAGDPVSQPTRRLSVTGPAFVGLLRRRVDPFVLKLR